MPKKKNPAAQALARQRWKKIGPAERQFIGEQLTAARKKIDPAKRKAIATKASQARWGGKATE